MLQQNQLDKVESWDSIEKGLCGQAGERLKWSNDIW